jgi:IS1 family transposase
VSIDRPSRFVVAWAFGPRTADLAEAVVHATRQRTADHAGIAWVSDGWEPYAETIADTYCDTICDTIPAGIGTWHILKQTPGVRLTQAVKHRHGRRLRQVEVRATIGAPVGQPHTVHVERLNGVLRDRLGCLTRKTHAFAKDRATWDAAVGILLFEHNWLRPHPALRLPLPLPTAHRRYFRRTPAMLLGLADRPWSWLDFLTQSLSHYTKE